MFRPSKLGHHAIILSSPADIHMTLSDVKRLRSLHCGVQDAAIDIISADMVPNNCAVFTCCHIVISQDGGIGGNEPRPQDPGI